MLWVYVSIPCTQKLSEARQQISRQVGSNLSNRGRLPIGDGIPLLNEDGRDFEFTGFRLGRGTMTYQDGSPEKEL